ncbi:MAG: thioredoxin domain-containing protein [Proteobacteria bacterium]|nr:thioredoxin domain-containing protein [Pseudomonadota bacterium]
MAIRSRWTVVSLVALLSVMALIMGGAATATPPSQPHRLLINLDEPDGWPDAMSPTDLTIGSSSAPITLVEYVSPMCPHCAQFESEAGRRLRSEYVDTGRVRFAFRELPVGIPDLSIAMFQVARCGNATPEVYVERVTHLMTAANAINAGYARELYRERLISFAQTLGLSADQASHCIDDATGARRAQWSEGYAIGNYGIYAAPTFVLNGQVLNVHSSEQVFSALDVALENHRRN